MKYPAVPLSFSLIGALLIAAATPASAAAPATDGLWHGAIALGGSLSGGNNINKVLTANADGSVGTQVDKITLYGVTNYASTKPSGGTATTSADALRLGGRYDRELGSDLFGFGAAGFETNKVTGLRSRESVQVGLGYHVIRSDATTFDIFAGGSGAKARYTNLPSGSGFVTILGEESTHELSDTTQFMQRLVTQLAGGELGKLTTWDLTLATALAGQWTLNTGLSLRKASVVAPGTKKTDSLLTVSLGYKF